MIINTLEPVNIILANVYLIMLLQLLFNWENSNCNTYSNIFQIVFILNMIGRLIFQEAYSNKLITNRSFSIFTLFSSLILIAIAIYESVVLANNPNDFAYNPDDKTGDLICFQNRIIFVAEIIICFLTVAKDIVMVGFGRGKKVEDSI